MKTNFIKTPCLTLASVAFLTACGGATTSTTSTPFDTLAGTTGGTVNVTALSRDTGTNAIGSTTGTYTYASAAATVAATNMTLDATHVLSLKQGGTDRYSYVAAITDPGGDYTLIALHTDPNDLPTNATIIYEGQAYVIVTNGTGTQNFEGSMDSTVTANFGTSGGNVAVELVNFMSTGTVTGSEKISFTSLDISGAGYVDGTSTTATLENFGVALTPVNTAAATIDVIGVFAGDTGTETAGVGAIVANDGQALVSFSGVKTN